MKFKHDDRLLYTEDQGDILESRIRRVTSSNRGTQRYVIKRPDQTMTLSRSYVETNYMLLTRLSLVVSGICK